MSYLSQEIDNERLKSQIEKYKTEKKARNNIAKQKLKEIETMHNELHKVFLQTRDIISKDTLEIWFSFESYKRLNYPLYIGCPFNTKNLDASIIENNETLNRVRELMTESLRKINKWVQG